MPETALQHFREDIARARAIVAHAGPLPGTNPAEQLLRSDLLRSAWMFAVGALDAYYCDAYTDVVACTANSKSRQPGITLPEWVYDIKFPIRAVLEDYDNMNWRWRMAARKMMERETVISSESGSPSDRVRAEDRGRSEKGKEQRTEDKTQRTIDELARPSPFVLCPLSPFPWPVFDPLKTAVGVGCSAATIRQAGY